MLEFGVLGPVIVNRSGQAADIRTTMLLKLTAILLCRPAQTSTVDALLEALWNGAPPSSARKTLQIYIHRLRRALGDENRVLRGPSGYSLTVSRDELDALRFVDLCAEADAAMADNNLPAASDLYGKGLGLWRGSAFENLTDNQLIAARARELEQLRLNALDQFAVAELRLGRHKNLVNVLAPAIETNPYWETLRGHMMLALYGSGRLADSLAEYRALRDQMADELGIEPGPELQALHQRILCNDTELLAVAHAPVAVSSRAKFRPLQLPADIGSFTGRVNELQFLDSLLASRKASNSKFLVTITGTAGVGKTSTAVHWAHKVSVRFPDGQLFINLRGFDPSGAAVEPPEALRTFLNALGVAPNRVPPEAEARSALFRSLVADKQLLVLLDNARDVEQVRPLLPGSSRCLVIVTSRNQLGGLVAAEGAHPLTLDLLSAHESRQLLVDRLGAARVNSEPEATAQMIDRCSGLPLALAVISSSALFRSRDTLASLVLGLDNIARNLDALSGDDPLTNVRAVFSWSYQSLGPLASRVFRLLAIHPGQEIGSATLADLAGVSRNALKPAVAEMVDAHLLTESGTNRYGIHDLLRAYATELFDVLETDADKEAARRRLVDHYLFVAHRAARALNKHRLPIPMDAEPADLILQEFANATAAHEWFATEIEALCRVVEMSIESGLDGHLWRFAWALGDFLTRQARWQEQRSIQHAALKAATNLAEPIGQGYAHRYLAVTEWANGRVQESEQRFWLALERFELENLITEQAMLYIDLAAFIDTISPTRSKAYGERALKLYREVGHSHGEAVAQNSIGMAHIRLGNHRCGLVQAQAALQTLLELEDEYGAAATWTTVGLAQRHLGLVDEAIASYRAGIALYRKIGRRAYVAYNLVGLGEAYLTAGHRDKAGAVWREAKAIYDELGVGGHEDLARKLTELNVAG